MCHPPQTPVPYEQLTELCAETTTEQSQDPAGSLSIDAKCGSLARSKGSLRVLKVPIAEVRERGRWLVKRIVYSTRGKKVMMMMVIINGSILCSSNSSGNELEPVRVS